MVSVGLLLCVLVIYLIVVIHDRSVCGLRNTIINKLSLQVIPIREISEQLSYRLVTDELQPSKRCVTYELQMRYRLQMSYSGAHFEFDFVN